MNSDLFHRRQRDVVVYIGGKWRSGLHFDILAVLDETDWTKKYS